MKKKSKFMKKNQNLWKINEKLMKIYEKIKIYEKKLKIILNFWTVPSGPLVKFSKKMEIVPSGPVPSGPSWLYAPNLLGRDVENHHRYGYTVFYTR